MNKSKLFLVLVLGSFCLGRIADAQTLTLNKGDRIALVGNSLAEGMQNHGWMETVIHSRFPEHDLAFRNLGFAGDEVHPSLRLRSEGFGNPDEWLTRVKADVVFAFFGYNESFGGQSGLEKFKKDLDAFIDNTQRQHYNGKNPPRLVLFSPIAHENLKDPNLPDGSANNKNLKLYTDTMAEVAKANNVTYIDLFTPTLASYAKSPNPWTFNGVHLNEYGDQQLALLIEAALLSSPPKREIKSLEKLRQAVLDRDWHWFQRYRVLDGFNVYGGRSHLKFTDNITNRTVHMRELEILDAQTANRDQRIWALAQGKDMKVDDSNAPPFIPVKTNIPGKGPDGKHIYRGGEESISKMKLPDGFAVNLFASEEQFPELAKGVQMAFDTRGRLWVAAWPTYPRWEPKSPMNDKLLIFEDTNGDGKADTCKTFADNLHCPTGFEFWNGGVLVAQAPYLVFLKDTNGDDKADVYERLVSHLDSADTHHTANSFVISPEGGLLWQEGTFHRTQIETPYGPPVRCSDGGVFRYDPRKQKLESYATYGYANPHGHVFDRWGNEFNTDGTGNANYYTLAYSGRLDYPAKHGGLKTFFQQPSRPCPATEILSSRHFPDSMQGNYLDLNVIGFLGIFQFQIKEEGSGFVGVRTDDLIQSSDSNFRPVDCEIGPDGAVYFLDWQNSIIGHMQHHLRDPNRDHTHGRIYRITYPGRPLLKPAKIYGEPIEKLLDLLKEPEDRVRYRVRIELSGRKTADVVAALPKWIKSLNQSDKEYEHHLLEALWVYSHHNVVNEDLLKRVLRSPNPNARASATRVLRYWRDSVKDFATLLKAQANDEHPRVRLHAVVAASDGTSATDAEIAIESLKYPTDYYLEYALKETMRQLDPYWRAALAAGKPFATDNPKGVDYLLKGVNTKDLLTMPSSPTVDLAILARSGGVPADKRKAALDRLAKTHNTAPINELLAAIDRTDGRTQAALISLLEDFKPAELAPARAKLEAFSTNAAEPEARQAALIALMAADQSAERAWQLASGSIRGISDILTATPNIGDTKLKEALYPKIKPLLRSLPPPLAANTKASTGTLGRFIRIDLPGNKRTLTLAEVEVMSGGKNIASGGKATQSSTGHGGAAERAIDGNKSGTFGDGGQTHSNENEKNPWWELDLGAEKPIESISVWNRTDGDLGKRLDGFKLSVLDASRKAVYAREGQSAPAEKTGFEVGTSDPASTIRAAAIEALSKISGHDAETFEALADLILSGIDPVAASAAIGSIPRDKWPRDRAAKIADALVASASKMTVPQRATPEFQKTLQFGRDLAALLPAVDAQKTNTALDALSVQIIHLKTVKEKMMFDLTSLTVEAGRAVAVIFENDCNMNHNFVLVAPGALEEVGKASDDQNENDPGLALKKQFIPDDPKVAPKILHYTKVILPNEIARLYFTAPAKPDDYPYLCTFPGHWKIMNGIMHVIAPKK